MNFKERDFIPMLFGGDINTYSVARAFYERYKVKSYTFGKFATGPSYQSRIIEYTPNPKIDTDEVFMKTVKSFCSKHADKTVVLVGCGDSYVALISKHKNELTKNTIAPYIDFDLMNSLQQKETFYKLCEKHGVDYPGTIIHNKEMGHDFEMNFPFPVILKPSDSIQYWEHPFDTQKKVYTIKDKKELDQVLDDIYGAGYTGKLIIQDMIPGNDGWNPRIMMEKLGSPRSLVYQQGTLKWNPVKNAIGYIVYDGEQILGTTTDTSFPVSEVNYALKVSAVNQYGTQGKKGVL